MGLFSWLRGKPKPARVDDLRAAERDWLDAQRQAPRELAGIVGVAADGKSGVQLCDDLFAWWYSQPESERIDPNVLVNAAGVALGDVLAQEFGLEWKIVTDQGRTDLALWRTQNQVIMYPAGSVAKRFSEATHGNCVGWVLSAARDSLSQLDVADEKGG